MRRRIGVVDGWMGRNHLREATRRGAVVLRHRLVSITQSVETGTGTAKMGVERSQTMEARYFPGAAIAFGPRATRKYLTCTGVFRATWVS
ncbi:MAG: hypothetical protein AAF671_07150 [Pseudomonadota bacterium]